MLIMRNIITLPEYNMPDMEENAVYPAMNSTHLYFVMTIMTIAAILAIAGKMQKRNGKFLILHDIYKWYNI